MFHEQCTGNVDRAVHADLVLARPSSASAAAASIQLGITETNPFGPDGVSHAVAGLGSGADMPRPVKTGEGGIRADVLTTGVPFMGGRAVFTSTVKAARLPGAHVHVGAAHLPLHDDPLSGQADVGAHLRSR